jgi:glycosyltransferase involved in cell wall biosynthesis
MLEQSAADEETVKRTLEYHKRLREPGVYEAGGVSGAILISRKALYAGVRFAPIPSVSLIGDDRHFSIRAAAIGLSLHVDTRCPAARIDAESALRAASAGEDREKPKAKTAQTEPREERQPMKRQEPITISLCMIVKNEEDAIGRCLESVRDIVDEIVIVDTGSTDRTKEIVRTFGANVFDFEWIDDFSAARNYAFAQATCEYILWLDADDYFKEKDRKLLKQLKRELDRSVDSVSMHYHLAFDANGNATHSLRRNRLVRRDRGYKWVGAVHEYLDVGGRIHLADIAVTHNKNKPYTDRNLQIYRRREKAGEPFTPRDRYYFANELRDNRFYEEAASHYVRFLDEGLGWVEDNIAACIKLADCYAKLNEPGKKLSALFKTMEYDTPRAEATYRIGVHFFEQNRIHQAIYWYELTTTLKKPVTLAMIENDMWTWMPHLQLCVCYDRIGDSERARRHNDIALSYNPTHPSMLHNKKYFESKLGVAP